MNEGLIRTATALGIAAVALLTPSDKVPIGQASALNFSSRCPVPELTSSPTKTPQASCFRVRFTGERGGTTFCGKTCPTSRRDAGTGFYFRLDDYLRCRTGLHL
jgi:hypothetical protein